MSPVAFQENEGTGSDALEFRMLGPLEVRHGEHDVLVTASRQRAVLVSLLLRRGNVVPVSMTVGDIWGDNPPENAVAAVRNYVRRLRTTLPLPVVETASAGYRLTVSAESVDTHRFAVLAAEARRRGSVDLFRRALALWRGEPLTDVGDIPVRDAFAASWSESYLAAFEDHVDLRLAHGEHGELVPELTEKVTRNPLRERLSGQLITALFASGRTAAALEVYRSTRAKMVEELGIEPGRELQRLERAVLTGDTDVLPVREERERVVAGRVELDLTGMPEHGGWSSPRGLPAPAIPFIGRTKEVADLNARFEGADGGGSTATRAVRAFVFGQGGCGKSALAVHVCHQLAHRYPGGAVYLDLGGSTPGAPRLSARDVLRQLVGRSGLGVDRPQASVEDLAEQYRSSLRGTMTLVVLDNAASYAQVAEAVGVPAGCALVCTSRAVIDGPGIDPAELMHVDALDESDAVELLARFAGARRTDAEASYTLALVGLCGRLPLALRLMGCRIARQPHWPLATWYDLLADERARLDELRDGGVDVRASLLVGLAGLDRDEPVDDDAGSLFVLLGLVAPPYITAALGAALTGWSPTRAGTALDRLVAAQMMANRGNGRYGLFDLVAVLAREQAAALGERRRVDVLCAAAEWYLASARQCSLGATGWASDPGLPVEHEVDVRAVPTFGSWKVARDWLDREFTVLVEVMAAAAAAAVPGVGRLVVDLLPTLPHYVNTARVWDRRVVLAKIALTAPGGSVAAGYRELAVIEAQRGNVERAHGLIERARAAVGDDPYLDVNVMLAEGTILGAAGRLDRAEAHLARTASAASAAGYRRQAIIAEHNMANVLRLRGRPLEALDLYERTYDASVAIGDYRCASGDITGMLLSYAALGRHHEVVTLAGGLPEALREPGVSHNRAEQLLVVALSLRQIGDHVGSEAHVGEAMRYLASIGEREQTRTVELLAQIEGEISLEQ